MTSWMECGCGGDVILHEEPGTMRYGREWNLLTGNCKTCGRYHETVPMNQRLEFHIAREQWEKEKEREAAEMQELWDQMEEERLSKLTPEELLEEVGEDHYPWAHLFVRRPGEGCESHMQYLTPEGCEKAVERMSMFSPVYYRIEQHHKVLKEGTMEASA